MNWYSRIAPIYDLVCRPLYWWLRRAALHALDLRANDVVIEIGCGTGLNVKGLARAASEVIALDCNEQMQRSAPQGLSNVNYVLGEPSAVADDSADKVLLCLVLNVADDWRNILAEAKRIVRPGGRIVIADARPLRGWWRWCNLLVVPIANWSGAADIRRDIWAECDEVRRFGGGYFSVGVICCVNNERTLNS